MSMNQAVCASGLETSVTYLFSLEELPKYDLHIVFLFGNCYFHIGDSYLDHGLYSENNAIFGLNYSSNSVTAGLSVRMLSSKVEGYQDATTMVLDGGLKWEHDQISSALALRNVTQSEYEGLTLPIIYLWESCYSISSSSKISLGLEKEDDFDFSLKFAGRYDILQTLTLISSYQFEPNRIGVGALFNLRKFQVAYSVRSHQYIGLTHYMSLYYEIFN